MGGMEDIEMEERIEDSERRETRPCLLHINLNDNMICNVKPSRSEQLT